MKHGYVIRTNVSCVLIIPSSSDYDVYCISCLDQGIALSTHIPGSYII